MIYVVIDEPHVSDQAHSTYATEFASEVLKDVLPMLGIYKQTGKSASAKKITLPSKKKQKKEINFLKFQREDFLQALIKLQKVKKITDNLFLGA